MYVPINAISCCELIHCVGMVPYLMSSIMWKMKWYYLEAACMHAKDIDVSPVVRTPLSRDWFPVCRYCERKGFVDYGALLEEKTGNKIIRAFASRRLIK